MVLRFLPALAFAVFFFAIFFFAFFFGACQFIGMGSSMLTRLPSGSRNDTLITPIRERWVVKIKGGPDLDVQGNILDHEYSIGEGRDKIAEVSKIWFRLRDTYGVSIDPGQDDALIVAVAVCIDEMAHGGR